MIVAEFDRVPVGAIEGLAYTYVNESVTTSPPIIYSRWEVRNSSGTLIAQFEDSGKVDFTYAFPYLDTFQVKLTVRDSSLNEDSETKEYVYDQYPIAPGGGGGPSAPAMAEKYGPVRGEIRVIDINWEYTEEVPDCERGIKVKRIVQANLNEFTTEDLNFSISLRNRVEQLEEKNREIEKKTQELIDLVHNPEDDIKPKKK